VASGTVIVKTRRFKLRRLRVELAPEHALTLRLRLERKPGAARLNRLVRRGAKARARIRLKATDAAGNPTSRAVTVHLTR
jgi:hypothetical protein